MTLHWGRISYRGLAWCRRWWHDLA